MIRIGLTPAARADRERTSTGTRDRRRRDRRQAVPLADRGRRRQPVAADRGGPRASSRRWRRAYPAAGLEGLTRRRVRAEEPRLTRSRPPGYRPQRNVIARRRRVLRRRARPHRLVATMAALRRALRAGPCCSQAPRRKVPPLIRAPNNGAPSGAA